MYLLLHFAIGNDPFQSEELRLGEAMRLAADHVAGLAEGRCGSELLSPAGFPSIPVMGSGLVAGSRK